MTTPFREPDDSLEASVDAMLRELPLRRAPADLSARVLARIENRRSATLRLESFRHWPVAGRLTFYAVSLGIAIFAVERFAWLLSVFDSHVLLNVGRAWTLWQAGGVVGASIARAIPPDWMYAVIGIVAALYLAFFAIGAAAYRSLYQESDTQRDAL